MRMKLGLIVGLVLAFVVGTAAAGIAAEVKSKAKSKEDDLHRILDSLRRIESRLDALEKAVRAGGGAASKAATLPEPPPGKVTVKAAWEYRDFIGTMELWEAPPGAKLWDTRVHTRPGERLPVGDRIRDDVLFLEPGKPRLAVIVYRNQLPKERMFYVIPHVADPSEFTADLDFKCACTGERYKVPANGAWSRVIEFKLAPKVKPGEKIYTWMVAVGEP